MLILIIVYINFNSLTLCQLILNLIKQWSIWFLFEFRFRIWFVKLRLRYLFHSWSWDYLFMSITSLTILNIFKFIIVSTCMSFRKKSLLTFWLLNLQRGFSTRNSFRFLSAGLWTRHVFISLSSYFLLEAAA